VAEYYDAMGDRYGMEKAYDTERHRALHFEQATELKDHHIENLETELRHLRRLTEKQESRAAAVEAEAQELASANEALRAELRELHEDGRAAASNLVAVAKRGLSGRGPGRG
jgi:predicted  nucleic acid-binding Zn-ribbon protein